MIVSTTRNFYIVSTRSKFKLKIPWLWPILMIAWESLNCDSATDCLFKKMGFSEELRSGKTAIYGQWTGWLASILSIILGITNLVVIPLFAILAIGMGAFLFLLEFTMFAKCIRGTDRIIAISQNLTLKTIIYSVFGLVMWLSLTSSATALIVIALLETLAAVFYGKFVNRSCSL